MVTVPSNYKPTEKEAYMNPVMLEYFRQKLLAWKDVILNDASNTLQELQDEGGLRESDIADRASVETDVALELRARDRQRKLISKIDEALERIRNNEYGYCEETGDPIGVKRLEARPVATLTVEAQERHERMERTHRDERE
ncbi:MAG: RNA polymerase-binding protein DksA [Proteobacteria bacterium]|jgi:DnaK suppressor protein|nr:RNA polymerase-binding protein DksA [Alphaproteobacteria bacterium]NCC03530.1 RNA polymerase-binding protein DksA [Pseudomonadota bacterium]